MKNVNGGLTAHGWFQAFAAAYAAELGYVFLLSGNIADLFPLNGEFVTLRQFWARQLSGREIVVFWDKSSGFSFGDEILGATPPAGQLSMREKYKVAVGVGQQPTAGGTANFLAGLAGGGAENPFPTDPEQAFKLLEKLLALGKPEDRKAAVVVEYVESVLPETDYGSVPAVTLQRWAGMDSPLRGTGNPVILVERNPERASSVVKHDDSNVVRLHLPRPNREEHAAYIAYALKAYGVKLAAGLDPAVVANLMAGLRCKDFEDFCMEGLESGDPIDDSFIWGRKTSLIEKQSGGALQVVRPKHGFESIGGLEYVKDALRVQIGKLRSGSKTSDKGWILMGPPGTGKTIIAEALAKESGVNFVMLGSVLSKYVGDSERNMRLALDIARAMAPTIIFVDEAAEAIGNGDGYNGDSGVSNRVRGMLQNVMGDDSARGELFFMLATNYPNRLAPAVLREGRMDKRVPLLVPDRTGREAILQALCRKYGIASDGISFDSALSSTEGWTGAELEALLLRAKQFAEEEEAPVETRHLNDAVSDYIPSRDQEAFDLMAALAIRYTNSRRLLPLQYRGQTAEAAQARIDELEPQVFEREKRRRGGLPL
ncbi:MAG: ATP-binding protein [Patescibacteria group bacterium]|nr:ATP-binding protein [Patescibacteria group bacterium]